MTANRQQQLQSWTVEQLHQQKLSAHTSVTDNASLEQQVLESWQIVAGDASFRCYYRVSLAEGSYIVMDAPPPDEDIATFIRVADTLRRGGVRVPEIFARNLETGFLLLEDFGDEMLRSYLKPGAGDELFERILPLLRGLSQCSATQLPEFGQDKITQELNLFSDWYLGRHCAHSLEADERAVWQRLSSLLIDAASSQPQCFVHRDFHSCNLHALSDGDTGVIDFQDAVCGPVTYDLVSWLWDRYISWPRAEIERWMLRARDVLAPEIADTEWQRYCDFMGLQRNLKIVGIFARLYYRDEKEGYMALVPQFASYIRQVVPSYPELDFCRPYIEKWLSMGQLNGS